MRWTKAMVQKWCDERGIELLVEHISATYHVHLNIMKSGKCFDGLGGIHNAAMWDWDDDVKIKWDVVGKGLEELQYADCVEPNCEFCTEEEELEKGKQQCQ